MGIVVAVVDIPLGSMINPNQVAVSAWPKDNYPKDALVDLKIAVGRIALRDFTRGEPIVESKLVPLNKASGLLSLKVPAGMRAFSVKVNEVVGVGGFLVRTAGSTSSSRRPFPEPAGKGSKIVLEDVRVLAAGQTIEQKENKPVTVNTVTLALTPEDTEKLALAATTGSSSSSCGTSPKRACVDRRVDKGAFFRRTGARPPSEAGPSRGKPRRSQGRRSPAVASAPPPKAYTVKSSRGTSARKKRSTRRRGKNLPEGVRSGRKTWFFMAVCVLCLGVLCGVSAHARRNRGGSPPAKKSTLTPTSRSCSTPPSTSSGFPSPDRKRRTSWSCPPGRWWS